MAVAARGVWRESVHGSSSWGCVEGVGPWQ